MTTTMLPEAPAPEPFPTTTSANRFVTIRANLLPDEIVAKRRLHALKRLLLLSLAALLVLIVAWYALALLQTSSAKSDLSSSQRTTAALKSEQQQFGPLVFAQSQSATIKAELTKLMVGDLQWKQMLTTLRSNATGGVAITAVTGTATVGTLPPTSTTNTGIGVLNQTGKQQVGTLTITGTAPDKNSVAAYIDSLTKVPGLAAPYPASVTNTAGKLTFSATVIITSDALGGRYAPANHGGH
jgi:Tfp pilus assembly protein PilN